MAAVKAWCPPVAATLQHAATVSSQQFTSLLLAALPAFALMLQGVGYELLNAGGAVQETTNTCAPIPPILWRRWSSRVQLSDAPLTNNSPSVSHLSQQRLDRRGKPGWCWQVCGRFLHQVRHRLRGFGALFGLLHRVCLLILTLPPVPCHPAFP